MRDFETDFEFDVDYGANSIGTSNCRIDKYRAVTFEQDWQNDAARAARVKAHQERVQREMSVLGITKGGRE